MGIKRFPIRGERVFEISAIRKVLAAYIKDPVDRTTAAMRCAAAAKTARRKYFKRIIKQQGDNDA